MMRSSVCGRDTQLAAWDGTTLEDALPATFRNKDLRGYDLQTDPNHKFITALPFDTMPEYLGMNVVAPKQDVKRY